MILIQSATYKIIQIEILRKINDLRHIMTFNLFEGSRKASSVFHSSIRIVRPCGGLL